MACEVCHKTYSTSDEIHKDSDEKPHLCKMCGHSFSLKIQLKRHLMLHADGAPYTCKKCAKESEMKGKTYNLRLGNKNEYLCDICQKSFSNKRLLLRHSIQHTFDRTSDTEEASGKIEKVIIKKNTYAHKLKHKPRKNSDKPELLSCHVCGRNFQSWLALEKHTLTHNVAKTPKTLFCQKCNRAFAYQACLEKHVKKDNCGSSPMTTSNTNVKQSNECSSEIDSKKHICSICGKTFARKSSLEGHELSHILNKETSEDEIEKYFSFGEDSDEYVSEPKKPRIPMYNLKKSYTCDKCNFVCFSKPTLEKHQANHIEKELKLSDKNLVGKLDEIESVIQKTIDNSKLVENRNKECLFNCEKCDKKFKTKGRLINHNLYHDKKENDIDGKPIFKCEICDKEFGSKKDLKQHIFSHDEKNSGDDVSDSKEKWNKKNQPRSKDFECEVCGKKFAGETCWKKHTFKHEHDGENSVGETSRTRAKKLKPVKELICEFCEEEFTGRRSAYVKHMHAHTPEVCGICDERFVDRQSLREHCKIHVGTEEGRMFMQCSQKALDAKNGIVQPEPKVEYIYLVLR